MHWEFLCEASKMGKKIPCFHRFSCCFYQAILILWGVQLRNRRVFVTRYFDWKHTSHKTKLSGIFLIFKRVHVQPFLRLQLTLLGVTATIYASIQCIIHPLRRKYKGISPSLASRTWTGVSTKIQRCLCRSFLFLQKSKNDQQLLSFLSLSILTFVIEEHDRLCKCS